MRVIVSRNSIRPDIGISHISWIVLSIKRAADGYGFNREPRHMLQVVLRMRDCIFSRYNSDEASENLSRAMPNIPRHRIYSVQRCPVEGWVNIIVIHSKSMP